MKLKFFIFVVICFVSKVNGQNSETLELDLSLKLYTKCFENLNHGSEIIEKTPTLKNSGLCSIQDCILSLAYKEEFIQEVAKARLIGIATQLFREGKPVILISGMDSSSTALEKNINIDDDNNIVYISVGECVVQEYVLNGKELFNQQTNKLLKKNKNGL